VTAIYHATYADEEAKDLLEANKDRIFVAPAISVTITRLADAGKHGLPSTPAMMARIQRDLDLTTECMVDLKRRGVRVLRARRDRDLATLRDRNEFCLQPHGNTGLRQRDLLRPN
jgi:hypothetical protein